MLLLLPGNHSEIQLVVHSQNLQHHRPLPEKEKITLELSELFIIVPCNFVGIFQIVSF
jgi:hypothetical protein